MLRALNATNARGRSPRRGRNGELTFRSKRFAQSIARTGTMPDHDHQHEKEEFARLERLNEELTASLKSCRKLLHDYEVRLTANLNDVPATEAETPKAWPKTKR